MAGNGGRRAAEMRMAVVLRDGTTAGEYRLAPPWERRAEPPGPGGGAAAGSSAETTASLTAVPAQGARLVLTIVCAGTTSSILLLPPGEGGEASSAQGQGTSSLSMEIHPRIDRAIVRLFRVAGSPKKWKSTGSYTLCIVSPKDNLPSIPTEQLFGDQIVKFNARRCQELPFPPFSLNFKQDFKSLGRLGKGTEGKVSMCSANFADYMCAVKEVVPSDLLITAINSEPSDVSLLAELNHPNVIKLDLAWNGTGKNLFGGPADATFISMMVSDRTLSGFLERNSTIDPGTANHIFHQIMMGLEHIHEHHIAHQDLKPENILIDNDLNVMISDFGIAQKKETPNGKINPGILGSFPYCAPEINNGHVCHDEKVDIFSAGIIYYELHTPGAKEREHKVKKISRLIRTAIVSWQAWDEFDLDGVLEGTGLLNGWGGNYLLFKMMVNPDDAKRPSASVILGMLQSTNTEEQFETN